MNANKQTPASAFSWIRKRAAAPLHRLAQVAARSYIAGDNLSDALAQAGRLAKQGLRSTVGYWDAVGESPDSVYRQYERGVEQLAVAGLDSYLSIKLPSLDYSEEFLSRLVERAQQAALRLHFDSLGPETVERTQAAIANMLPLAADLSYTLPGRWRRSVGDADWAIDRKLAVRVVKGQWADATEPNLDPRTGYLAVIDRLAGRARAVAVASHDPWLVRQSLERLTAAGTDATLELLFGLPTREPIAVARQWNVPVRIYVPYGAAYLPYCVGQLKRNPRLAWWLVRDAVAARFSRGEVSRGEFSPPRPAEIAAEPLRASPSDRASRFPTPESVPPG